MNHSTRPRRAVPDRSRAEHAASAWRLPDVAPGHPHLHGLLNNQPLPSPSCPPAWTSALRPLVQPATATETSSAACATTDGPAAARSRRATPTRRRITAAFAAARAYDHLAAHR